MSVCQLVSHYVNSTERGRSMRLYIAQKKGEPTSGVSNGQRFSDSVGKVVEEIVETIDVAQAMLELPITRSQRETIEAVSDSLMDVALRLAAVLIDGPRGTRLGDASSTGPGVTRRVL